MWFFVQLCSSWQYFNYAILRQDHVTCLNRAKWVIMSLMWGCDRWFAYNLLAYIYYAIWRGIAVQVTGFLTQGRGDGKEWVTSFMVSHSVDGFQWQYVTDMYGNQQVSSSSSSSSMSVINVSVSVRKCSVKPDPHQQQCRTDNFVACCFDIVAGVDGALGLTRSALKQRRMLCSHFSGAALAG